MLAPLLRLQQGDVSTGSLTPPSFLEAKPGVEPGWPDLQSGAWPFCHIAGGTGGRDRTPADAVLETAALPLSYAGKDGSRGWGRTTDILINSQAFCR